MHWCFSVAPAATLLLERRIQRTCTMPGLESEKQCQQQEEVQGRQQGACQDQQLGPSRETAVSAALKAVRNLATSLPAGADAAYADGIGAVMPLLRAAPATASSSVAAIRGGIDSLHEAVAEGKDLERGALKDLVVGHAGEARTPRVETERLVPAKRRVGQALRASKKHAVVQEARRQQQQLVQDEPCASCGDKDGEQILRDFCLRSWHLQHHDPPLAEVPAGTWLCSQCSAAGHLDAIKEALRLHARWVLSKFPGIGQQFYGQLSYSSVARLSIQYEDGEAYDLCTVSQVKGREPLVDHSRVKLLHERVVPVEVVRAFKANGWYVEPEASV